MQTIPSAMDLRSLLTVLCSCALLACDQQAGIAYRGEPLLSITGSVQLTRSRVDGPLVPAIGFVNDDTKLFFLDGEVQGEFPSSFTFHLYEPPPEPALIDGQDMAIGYITAVPVDHVSSVQTGVPVGGPSACTADDVCSSEQTWCTQNGRKCYSEETVCVHASSPSPVCTTESSGSEELRQSVFSQFEGLSLAYRIVYLKTPEPADTDFANSVGSPDGLAAGYHLFRVESAETASREAQLAAFEACQTAIRERAVELFNAAEDTDLSFEDVYESDDVSDETLDAVRALEDRAAQEITCAAATEVVQPIDDPLSHPISVVIGPNLVPD